MRSSQYLLFLLILAAPVCAQTESPAAGAPTEETTPSVPVRILSRFKPAQPGPLTESERFHDYLLNAFGPGRIAASAASAGLSQANDRPREWEQGVSGYSKRLGSNMGYFLARETINYGLSVPLHEDNRYFASGKRGWARVGHAAAATFLAQHPDGSRSLSFSTLAGVVGGALVARTWAPPSYSGAGYVVRTEAIGLGATAAFNIFREFTPDLIRKLQKRKKK